MRTGEFLLINVPVFLFLCGALLSGFVAITTPGIIRIVGILAGWWCLCGACMLLIDFRRKKKVFYRIAFQLETRNTNHIPAVVGDTFCGRCIIWALHYRARCARTKEISLEE